MAAAPPGCGASGTLRPAMRRLQLVELHDTRWFPGVWRDLVTDFLAHYAAFFRPYSGVVDVLAEALERSGTTRMVDLGAGGGSTVLELKAPLDRALGRPVTVVLTDKYPNHGAFSGIVARHPTEVEAVAEPVDATVVPVELVGFRTMFSSFHHFEPPVARAILADAVRQGRGIGVFEYTERRLVRWLMPLILIPALIWSLTPFIRPFAWRRLLWTYLLPVVPLVALWDGFVSVLRSYTPEELTALVDSIEDGGFRWQVGRAPSVWPCRVTYLVGTPQTADGRPDATPASSR